MIRIAMLTVLCLSLVLPELGVEVSAARELHPVPESANSAEDRRRQRLANEAEQSERTRKNGNGRKGRDKSKWCGNQAQCRKIYGIGGGLVPLLLVLFKVLSASATLTGNLGFFVRLCAAVRHSLTGASRRQAEAPEQRLDIDHRPDNGRIQEPSNN